MKRRSRNKQKHAGDPKKHRSSARNAGRGAGMAGPDGEPRGKRRPRNAGTVARMKRQAPQSDPDLYPGGKAGSFSNKEGGRSKTRKKAEPAAGERNRQEQRREPGDETRGARRPEEHGGTRYMNRGAGNQSNRGDTHGGKKPYNPAAKVRRAS